MVGGDRDVKTVEDASYTWFSDSSRDHERLRYRLLRRAAEDEWEAVAVRGCDYDEYPGVSWFDGYGDDLPTAQWMAEQQNRSEPRSRTVIQWGWVRHNGGGEYLYRMMGHPMFDARVQQQSGEWTPVYVEVAT